MSISIVELMDKNEQIYRQKTEQELQALRAQLNPHFIYNTLNTIKWMAVMENADNITECITALGCLLEPILNPMASYGRWVMRLIIFRIISRSWAGAMGTPADFAVILRIPAENF